MWEERASRVGRRVVGVAASGAGAAQVHEEALRLVDAVVGVDLACWATIDPDTLAIAAMTSGAARVPAQYGPLLAEAEVREGEPLRFADLAVRGQVVARGSDLPAAVRAGSARRSRVWEPLGMRHELRLVLLGPRGECWGGAGLVRSGSDFTDRETAFLAAVAPVVAAATRVAVLGELAAAAAPRSGPAVVVVADDGRLRSATPAARAWAEDVDGDEPGRFAVLVGLVAARARAAASGAGVGALRGSGGGWALLHASALVGPDAGGDVAVVLEPATGDRLLLALMRAYGLSAREQEVVREVAEGRSTAEIADRLCITAGTVQDHLTSAFAKTGARRRGDLLARLRPGGP